MNRRVCALTLLYLGSEISPEAVNAIAEVLRDFHIVDSKVDITVIYKDAESIANAILAKESGELQVKAVAAEENEALIAAISHIGNMFKEDLAIAKSTRNYAPFIVHVLKSSNNNPTLQKSVRIVNDTKSISQVLLKKYGLTDKALEAIRSLNIVI